MKHFRKYFKTRVKNAEQETIGCDLSHTFTFFTQLLSLCSVLLLPFLFQRGMSAAPSVRQSGKA